MRIHTLLAAFAALLLAVAPAAAQAEPGGQPGLQVLRESELRPLEQLMAVRDELQLTDPQVARLRQIAIRLEQTNRPLRRQLFEEYGRWREQRRLELERMTPAQRQAELRRIRAMGEPPVPPPLRPLVARIRGNMRHALREAGTVLTPGQKARARELVREHRAGRRGPMRRGRWGGRP
ncbi:MAG TPA: hypothetical protein VFJ16_04970 [Longimicrobium sp.]|nr:hypothetical protein [Longimicrobium sp.]